VLHGYGIRPVAWQAAVLAALLAALLLVLPHQARAQGLFDFKFGGFSGRRRPTSIPMHRRRRESTAWRRRKVLRRRRACGPRGSGTQSFR